MAFVNDYTALLAYLDSNSLRWNGMTDVGTSVVVTYSFVETANLPDPVDSAFDVSAYWSFSDVQRGYFRDVLAQYEAIAGVIFVEVTGEAMINVRGADVRGVGGWASMAQSTESYTSRGGFVNGVKNMEPGRYGYQLNLHELGHAMGLEHPHAEDTATLDPVLDTQDNSVMTYQIKSPYATDLAPFDKLAIAHLYGAVDQVAGWVVTLEDDGRISMRGSERGETMIAADRDTRVAAGDGDDMVFGREWNDTLIGGAGDDALSGSAGDDMLLGGAGNDEMLGGSGGDKLFGGIGNDQIDGAQDDDMIFGGAGHDVLMGGSGADLLRGGVGNDEMHGGAQADTLFGNDGDDTLFGDGSNDILVGGKGNDSIDGGGQSDLIFGGAGEDTLLGGIDGNDTIFGGAGADVIDGGAGWDEIYGDAGSDWLSGGSGGSDTLYGGAGNDTLVTVSGNDVLWGGDGADIFVFEPTIGYATVRVEDFTRGEDVLDYSHFAGTAWENVAQFNYNDGEGVLVYVDTDHPYLLLSNVASGALTQDDFIFG